MIKLIALDIDGTLLNSERKISSKTLAVLHKARGRGCVLALATGRAFMSLQDVLELAGCISYVVTSNGGGVFSADGTMMYAYEMPEDLIRSVIKTTNDFGIFPEMYIGGQAYASAHQLDNMFAWGIPKETCGYILQTRARVENFSEFAERNIGKVESMDVLMAPMDIRTPLRCALECIEGLAVSASSPFYVDVNAQGISKASGLAHLCKSLGLGREEIIAFGDAENDREMLSFAGIGVAMGNCVQQLREHADHVTDDNNSDGIYKALRYFEIV